jgi:hypothetical protein
LAFASRKIKTDGPAPLNATPKMPGIFANTIFRSAGNSGQSDAR